MADKQPLTSKERAAATGWEKVRLAWIATRVAKQSAAGETVDLSALDREYERIADRVRARAATLLVAVLLLAGAAACGLDEGPAGRVTAGSMTYHPEIKQWQYRLTVRAADGKKHTFRVYRTDYKRCEVDEQYPACTHG